MARRLAAILAADVVDYSRLMNQDEAGTLSRLKSLRRDLVQPNIEAHRGRIVKLMGDGLLAEFSSVVEAMNSAVEIQDQVELAAASIPVDEQIHLRIGINLGDVIVEGTDIYGDGVNVAARLEKLAEPGGIYFSQQVYDHVDGKLTRQCEKLGEQKLRNIARPIHVYRVSRSKVSAKHLMRGQETISLPDKPSIAVLPFSNLSTDANQDYFADGIVEDIITALSHMRWLFVIARNSSFIYKGKAVDIKQVGRELGVRYVLEGSVRKARDRLRITGQLIDAATGVHLWARHFDGGVEDIFDLQDQVTSCVVGAIAPELERAEIERAKHKPTGRLDAYDYYLRGMACVHTWEREANDEALSHFYKAVELDPNFAAAYGMAARCYSWRKVCGWMSDPAKETTEAINLARRAAALGRDDAIALCTAGIALAFVGGQLDDGYALIEQALALNPNLAWAWLFSGWVKVWRGEPEAAIEQAMQAMRLSPHDPHTFNMQAVVAAGHFFCGRYVDALSWAKIAMRSQIDAPLQTCVAAASAGQLGDEAEAERAVALVQERAPSLRISNIKDVMPLQRPEDIARWQEGLRKAKLSE